MIVYGQAGERGLSMYYFGAGAAAVVASGICDVPALSHMGIAPAVASGAMSGADVVAETELC